MRNMHKYWKILPNISENEIPSIRLFLNEINAGPGISKKSNITKRTYFIKNIDNITNINLYNCDL